MRRNFFSASRSPVAVRISGHKTDSVFRRYNIVDERDLVDAAKKIESVQLSWSLAKNEPAEQVDEKIVDVQNETIQ